MYTGTAVVFREGDQAQPLILGGALSFEIKVGNFISLLVSLQLCLFIQNTSRVSV